MSKPNMSGQRHWPAVDQGLEATFVQPRGLRQEPAPPETVRPAPERHRQVVLDCGPRSAKAARDFTKAALRDWELSDLADDAAVIASELVTNAIQHCGPHALVEMAWQRHADQVTCLVTDRNPNLPVLAPPADPDAESGRGLWVVQALAADWGWMTLGSGAKAVWASLRLGQPG